MKRFLSIFLSIMMMVGLCPLRIDPLFAQTQTIIINDFDTGTEINQMTYYGSWGSSKGYPNLFYNGDEHWVTINESNWDDTYVEISFFGTAISLYGKKEGVAGIQTVYMDGEKVADIDAFSSKELQKQELFDSSDYIILENDFHVMRYQPSKTKNEAASGYNMQIDYAEVTYETTGVLKDAYLTETSYEVKLGKTLNVVPGLLPSEADVTLTFTSLDESVAKVDALGNITTMGLGSTVIEIYVKELDKTLSYDLTVIENVREIKVDDSVTEGEYRFTYSKGWAVDSKETYGEDIAEHWTDKTKFQEGYPSFTFDFVGKQVKLYGHKCPSGPIAKVYIDDVEVGTIDYYASKRINNSLLFDSGEISEGTHKIKVELTSEQNEAASASQEAAINFAMVYINEAYFNATGISLSKSMIYLEPGLDTSVTYSVQPSFAENVPPVVYTSEDESIATVDQNGHISATGIGTTYIIATLEGTQISDRVKVVVRESKEELSAQVSDNNTHRFPDSYLSYLAEFYDAGTLNDRSWQGSGWRNDHLTSRIDVFTRLQSYDDVRIVVSDFVSDTSTLAAEHIQATYLLAPLDSKNNRRTMDIISDLTTMDLPSKDLTGIWVDIYLPKDAVPGTYQGTIQLIDGTDTELARFNYTVEVLDLLLPDELSTHLELWMYPYSSNRYYSKQTTSEYFNTEVGYSKTDVRSLYYVHLDPQYEAGLRSQLALYAKAGGDAITVTVVEDAWSTQTPDPYPSMVKWKKNDDGTWSFDYTDLDYWVNLNLEYGIDSQIKSFSLSPWGGRITYYDEASDSVICESVKTGGDRWKELYTIFLTDYMAHMESKGWFDKTYLSMDELSLSQVRPVVELVHSIQNKDGESFKISLAANSYEAEEAFDYLDDISLTISLLNRDDVVNHRNETGLFTTFYTCGGGYGAMANPPGHSAFAIYTSYRTNVKGYLRWALDSFNANPYATGANPLFVDGDIYLIYPDAPDADTMEAKSSPRFEKFIEGMREVEKLKYLESEHAWLKDEVQQLHDHIDKSYSAAFMQKMKQNIVSLSKKAIQGEPVKGIHLDEEALSMYVGDETSLTYSTYPFDLIETSNNQQIWLSDDQNIQFIGNWSPDPTGAWVGVKYENMTTKGYEFDFTGNYFKIVGKKEPYLCQLDVYVDDVKIAIIDPYATSASVGQTLYESPTLDEGTHHVKVIGNGQTSTGTTGTQYFHLYSIETGSKNDVVWSSDGDTVSVSQDGNIQAVKAGTANVKVSFKEYEDTITIEVKDKRIMLDQETYYLAVDGKQKAVLSCEPTDLLSKPKAVKTLLYHDASLSFEGKWGADYTGKWISLKTPEEAKAAKFTFTFTGNQFKIIGNKESVSGMCDVYINGEYVDTYNPYSTARLEQEVLYTSEKLTYGEYTVEVRGRGEASGTNYYMHMYSIELLEYENIQWNMEDESIATITNNEIQALASGETTLYVGSAAYQTQANVVVYDKSALQLALENDFDESLYTAQSWSVYAEAYMNGQDIADKKEVTQAEIDAAVQALQAAVKQLEFLPQQLEDLIATVENYKTIQLTWKAYDKATTYVVERFSNGEWMEIAQTSEPVYIATGLKTGKEYTYRVKADNSKYSEPVSAVPMLEGKAELSIVKNGEDKFDLSWTGVDGATRYIIYRKAGDGAWKKILTLGKDARSYTTKSTAAGTYKYQVKAARYDSTERVMTDGSNIVEGIIGAETMKPASITVNTNGNIVEITWDKVVGVKGYEIYRAKNGGAYRHIKTTASTSTTYTLTTGTYQYKIRGYVVVDGEKVYLPEVVTETFTIE